MLPVAPVRESCSVHVIKFIFTVIRMILLSLSGILPLTRNSPYLLLACGMQKQYFVPAVGKGTIKKIHGVAAEAVPQHGAS